MSSTYKGQRLLHPTIPAIMLSAAASRQLLATVESNSESYAKIILDSSLETMRQLSPDFQVFKKCAEQREPIHMAVLIERMPVTCARLSDLAESRLK